MEIYGGRTFQKMRPPGAKALSYAYRLEKWRGIELYEKIRHVIWG